MGKLRIAAIAVLYICLLSDPGSAGSISGAANLGDDFQRQMPYSKEGPQSGETPGQIQPGDYTAPPERERTDLPAQPRVSDSPLCFNPYTGGYETCYAEGSEYWRERYNSPDYRYWWEQGRTCPPGYYFRPGRGCFWR